MRLGLVVIAEAAEENVVRTLLAEFQRLVAGLGAAGAHHQPRLETLDRLGELGLAAVDVDAVGPDAAGDARVAGHDRRDSRLLRDRHDLFGKAWKAASSMPFDGRMTEATSPPEIAAANACGKSAAPSPGGAISTMRQRLGGEAAVISSKDPGAHDAYGARWWLDCGIDQGSRDEKRLKQSW